MIFYPRLISSQNKKYPRQNIEWKETNIELNESLFTKKDYKIQSTLKREDKDLISTNDFERSKEKSDSFKGENRNIARKFLILKKRYLQSHSQQRSECFSPQQKVMLEIQHQVQRTGCFTITNILALKIKNKSLFKRNF